MLEKKVFSQILLSFLLLMPSFLHAGAADELQKAKFEERTHSRAAAFETAMNGLKKFPNDRNLFIYALDLSAEASQAQLVSLEKTAISMAEKFPKDYIWNLGACRVRRLNGKTDEALQNCLRSLQYGRGEFQPNLEISKVYLAMSIFDRAEEFIASALEINPADFDALYTRGEIYERQELYVKAKKAYASALSFAGEDISAIADANATKASAAIRRVNSMQKKQKSRLSALKYKENKGVAAASCIKKFEEEAAKEDFTAAAETGKNCRRKDPRNLDLASKLADVLVNAGEYEEAVDEYERAQKLTGEEHARHAALCIKEAETLIRLEDRAGAENKYRMAAAAAPFDTGILTTVADYFLKQTKYKEAFHYFSLILQIDPNNKYALANAEKLNLDMMSDEDILAEMKKRGAISQRATINMLTEKDLRLHRNMRTAEAGGAVEVVRGKFPGRHGLYYEENDNGLKFRLTLEGYNAYARAVSRDAIRYFESKGISLREIFRLRDSSGDSLFDKNGQITPEGINAWTEAATTGKITWIFSYQPVPGSKKQVKASRELAKLAQRGYREISEPEYLWLLKATNCPAYVLSSPPVNLTEINDGAINHYMLCYDMPCTTNENKVLPSYIERYRNGDTSISTGRATGFFGSGATRQYRFCEDGKLWTGGVDEAPPVPGLKK